LKTVLILVYYWPPQAGSGVQRWLKFVKYLPEFGWNPVIITPRNGTAPYYDKALLNDVPPQATIIHTETLEPFALYNTLQGKKRQTAIPVGMIGVAGSTSPFKRFSAWIRGNLFIPDARKGWQPYAQNAALSYIQENKVDVIVTTGPPHSTHLAGLWLKKKTGLPWLADLRDPWTNIYYNASLSRSQWARAKDRKYEDAVLATADSVTVVSPGMAAEFGHRAKELAVIYNGFDTDDFPTPVPDPRPGFFTLAHVGNFFPSLASSGLVEALQLLLQNPKVASVFRFRFVGLLDPGVEESFRSAGLGTYLELVGTVEHKQAVAEMCQANMLLFSISKDGDTRVLVSGKVFEYLATGVPILAIGDSESGAANILNQAARPAMVAHSESAEILQQLTDAFTRWEAHGTIRNPSGQQFSRKALTHSLSDLLLKLSTSH
jgi:glycosyltransferase involved in cell wall biosynthesis